jgi:hypothetical protein
MWLGVGPHRSALLTLLPAALAAASIAAVVVVGRRVRGGSERWYERALGAVADGTREAGRILRGGDWRVIAGSLGYWAFDNAVLWATLRAFGESPAVTLVLMGYLIGQLGGLLPLPGGLGGIDGGLLGTLIVYGLPAAAVGAAILAYRVILFWIPLILAGPAFFSLRKALGDPDRPDVCDPLARAAAQPACRLGGRVGLRPIRGQGVARVSGHRRRHEDVAGAGGQEVRNVGAGCAADQCRDAGVAQQRLDQLGFHLVLRPRDLDELVGAHRAGSASTTRRPRCRSKSLSTFSPSASSRADRSACAGVPSIWKKSASAGGNSLSGGSVTRSTYDFVRAIAWWSKRASRRAIASTSSSSRSSAIARLT